MLQLQQVQICVELDEEQYVILVVTRPASCLAGWGVPEGLFYELFFCFDTAPDNALISSGSRQSRLFFLIVTIVTFYKWTISFTTDDVALFESYANANKKASRTC